MIFWPGTTGELAMAVERPPRNIKPTEREAMQERWYKLTEAFDRELHAQLMSEQERARLLREANDETFK